MVGAGEATMAMCCNIGRRFSIVTIWPPKLNFIYHERLRNCGMEDRCVSIRNVLVDDAVNDVEGAGAAVSCLEDHNARVIGQILKAIDLAVSEDSADSIILGCTCMAPVGPEIAKRAPVPVLESSRAGYKTVEALLALGVRHSDVAYPRPNPRNLDAIGVLVAGQGEIDLGGDCEVCVITQDAAE